jgi:hypothetical protein
MRYLQRSLLAQTKTGCNPGQEKTIRDDATQRKSCRSRTTDGSARIVDNTPRCLSDRIDFPFFSAAHAVGKNLIESALGDVDV